MVTLEERNVKEIAKTFVGLVMETLMNQGERMLLGSYNIVMEYVHVRFVFI